MIERLPLTTFDPGIAPTFDRQGLAPAAGATGGRDYGLATVTVMVVVTGCMLVSAPCRHWFVIPVAVCGVLTGADVAAWLRRRLDAFDPKAIVGLLWFHGTFVAPLLHVSLQAHADAFDSQVLDWPKWFGRMALLTAAGLVLYKLLQRYFYGRTRSTGTVWLLNDGSFRIALTGAVIISAVAAAIIFLRFGALRKEFQFLSAGGEESIHVSWLLMLGDPLPLLIVVGLIRSLSVPRRSRSMVTVSVLLIVLLVAQFLLLGLRGSRGAVLSVLFLVTALCHYRLRRIPVTWVLIGIFALGIAGYYYAFFKRFGSAGFEALRSAEIRKSLGEQSGITPLGVLLGDLSRAEIQTFLLYRLTTHEHDYQLRRGQTYVFAGLTIIPRAIWPGKPSALYGKVAAGTDLQFGEGTFRSGGHRRTRVYGLAGEAMLNFGALGVLPAYLIFGALLGWYRRKLATLHPEDARFLLVPIFTMVAFLAAYRDADNTVFPFLKNGLMLVVVVWASSSRIPLLRRLD